MIVLGLVHDRPWDPPPEPQDQPPQGAHRRWHVPWRPLAWFATWCWLMALVPIVSGAFGGLAGYGVLLVAVTLVGWRVDRWCARQYWAGLREHKS
jgi:hypothetical protein